MIFSCEGIFLIIYIHRPKKVVNEVIQFFYHVYCIFKGVFYVNVNIL